MENRLRKWNCCICHCNWVVTYISLHLFWSAQRLRFAVEEDCNCTCKLSERCKICYIYIYENLSMYSFFCTCNYTSMELAGFAKLLIQKLNLTIYVVTSVLTSIQTSRGTLVMRAACWFEDQCFGWVVRRRSNTTPCLTYVFELCAVRYFTLVHSSV
jgi:hypothetical protein